MAEINEIDWGGVMTDNNTFAYNAVSTFLWRRAERIGLGRVRWRHPVSTYPQRFTRVVALEFLIDVHSEKAFLAGSQILQVWPNIVAKLEGQLD